MFIDPRHLEQLAVIVESETLQEAAEKIGTSQPALSRMIKALEERSGTLLFDRDSKPLKATHVCRELASQGKAVQSAQRRAEECVQLAGQGMVGSLKLGVPPFLCRRLVSEAVASFVSERSTAHIELIPDYHAGLQQRLIQNVIDVIVAPSKFVDHNNAEFALEPLFEDSNVIVGRAEHPLFRKKQITGKDLSSVTWIGHSDSSILRYDMETALKLMGVQRLHLAFQSGSADAIVEVLRHTDLLTVLPRYAIRADGSDGLAIAPVVLPNSVQVICIITYAGREESELMRDFKQHLRRHIAAETRETVFRS
ncbi:LysR family transcriptional regulator [uncultured Roseibium sp.]|uniref:LysR family transcriptional regulator n=1 Tax=uncultured Roseibium sp. TaxID=1936171 RepID=UPI002627CE82|nr:LysR family transcriptional regulator [uncultured Roseibium sp.]